MKIKTIVLIAGAFIGAIACEQKKIGTHDSTTQKDTVSNVLTDALAYEDATNIHKPMKSFESIFVHSDPSQSLSHTLGVTWITQDSIQFRFKTKDDLCDTDYSGIAINNFPDGDPEIDEDADESYAAIAYVEENKEYLMTIRISIDRTKANVTYSDRTGEETDCSPYPVSELLKKVR